MSVVYKLKVSNLQECNLGTSSDVHAHFCSVCYVCENVTLK
jgi:hypothetical protein